MEPGARRAGHPGLRLCRLCDLDVEMARRSRELSATAGLVWLSTPDAIVRRRYEPAARDAVPAARLAARDDLAGPPHRAT